MDLRYYADIENIAGNKIRLEIYVNQYSGEPEELILDSNAISIEYSAETLFDALKPSLAHINLYTTSIKMDLFSTNYNDVAVKIYKNNALFWVGYTTPNIYNQPYCHYYDPITLECVDIVSNLGNMQYKSNNGITSLLSIISKCLDMADNNHFIQTMYVDRSITLNGDNKLLQYAFIEERNFFDEKMNAANCDEVVGSILKTFGLTMIQYKDAFYIIEQGQNLLSSYSLNEYNYSNGNWVYNNTAVLSLPVNNTYTIGAGGTNGQISLDNVYNKVTIIANNNPLDAMLPDFSGKNDLVNQNVDSQHYEDMNYTIDDNTYKLLGAYFNSTNNWYNYPMYVSDGSTASEVSEMHMSTLNSSTGVCGMIWNKATQYNTIDGEPSTLNWQTYMSMLNWGTLDGPLYEPCLELKKNPKMIFDGGYLIINLTYKLSTSRFPHDAVRSQYNNFASMGYYDKVWSDSIEEIGAGNWPNYTMFPCLLKIGDYFYNGENWILQSDYNSKVTWWNTLYDGRDGIDYVGTNTWYRTWNTSYDDWEYVTQTQYDNFSGTKETGQCKSGHAHYVYRYDSGDTYVYITDEFYYQKNYGNYCFLIRNNISGNSIMDTNYQLTNTVSYKMKIINSSDGMAIKIDRPLYGEVQFILYQPIDNVSGVIIGRDPQWQSSKADGTCKAVHISNLTLKYQKTTEYQDIFNDEDVNPDTIYSNVINSNYCKELEDVTLTVNTANDWANSYSYLIKQNGNNYDYIKELSFGGTTKRPEERLVEKYVNYYSTPKIQYGATILNNMEIYPFQPIYETMNNVRKNFIICNLTYNLSLNNIDINTCQI